MRCLDVIHELATPTGDLARDLLSDHLAHCPSCALWAERNVRLDQIWNESGNGLSNTRGTIAMARTNNPNSATAQFFINLFDTNSRLDTAGGGYTVFGKVTSGMDVVDAIAKVRTGFKNGHDDVPLKPIYIKSAKRKAKS